MDYPLIINETSEGYDEGGGGGEEGYEGDDGGDEEWAGPSQEEWQQMVQYQQQTGPVLAQLGQYLNDTSGLDLNQYQGYEQPQQQEEEFDPYDAESVQSYIGRSVQQGIEQALGPFQGILGTVASREGENMAKAELDRIAEDVGDFDRDNAFLVASSLIESGGDPAQSLRQAAQHSRDFEARIRADEREKYRAELEQLAGAPREATTGSSSATENLGVPTGPDRYRIAVQRALPAIAGNNDMPVG